MTYYYSKLASPVGELTLVASAYGLTAVLWENDNPKRVKLAELKLANDHPILKQTRQQLQEYFEGLRQTFDLPLDMHGTAFQKAVWHALLTIPYGETRYYAQIAEQINHAQAMRAVGAANGKNPLSIVVPCHRVIGSNGKLTGFAGGLQAKAYLLALERKRKF